MKSLLRLYRKNERKRLESVYNGEYDAALVWTTSYVMLGRVAIPSDEKLDVSIQAGTVLALIVLLVGSTFGGWLVSLVVQSF